MALEDLIVKWGLLSASKMVMNTEDSGGEEHFILTWQLVEGQKGTNSSNQTLL